MALKQEPFTMPDTTTPEAPLLLSVKQTSRALGICERSLFKLFANNDGPPRVHIGRRTMIRREALEAWLKAREKSAPAGAGR
jgi:predicted DNA-binding transcriptional regulator AlpA